MERFWSFLTSLDSDIVAQFMKDNLAGTVVVFSLLIWIPASCYINRIVSKLIPIMQLLSQEIMYVCTPNTTTTTTALCSSNSLNADYWIVKLTVFAWLLFLLYHLNIGNWGSMVPMDTKRLLLTPSYVSWTAFTFKKTKQHNHLYSWLCFFCLICWLADTLNTIGSILIIETTQSKKFTVMLLFFYH